MMDTVKVTVGMRWRGGKWGMQPLSVA